MARGVAHLHQHKIVHRDLASRNFLVTSKRRILVSDFGLSRGLQRSTEDGNKDYPYAYQMANAGIVPFRSCSPETMIEKKWTKSSDVWTFGKKKKKKKIVFFALRALAWFLLLTLIFPLIFVWNTFKSFFPSPLHIVRVQCIYIYIYYIIYIYLFSICTPGSNLQCLIAITVHQKKMNRHLLVANAVP